MNLYSTTDKHNGSSDTITILRNYKIVEQRAKRSVIHCAYIICHNIVLLLILLHIHNVCLSKHNILGLRINRLDTE